MLSKLQRNWYCNYQHSSSVESNVSWPGGCLVLRHNHGLPTSDQHSPFSQPI